MDMLCILWYCIVLHVIALYCIHGIAWYCIISYGIALLHCCIHGIAWYCIVSYGIAWYCIVGFGARAVSRKTPIYFIGVRTETAGVRMETAGVIVGIRYSRS